MVSDRSPLLMIEFLASVDPMSLPVVAALLFSLSLYPLGFMLGASCSPCCGTPCEECETGTLPDTVTVTFDGYPDVGPSFDALFVSLDSCYGFGATAAATTAAGAITAITVTDGGSGYAVLARVEPTITAAGPGGTGADITVTVTEEADACGLPYWAITGLDVVEGGSGYVDGDEIVFTLGDGDVEQAPAGALVQTSRAEPELTIEPPEDTGTGATFTVELTPDDITLRRWFISGIAVTDGGTGYTDGDIAAVGLGSGDVEQSPAFLIINNERAVPELTLTENADLTVNVSSVGGSPELWEISSVTVNNGGIGYDDGQYISLSITPGDGDVVVQFPTLRIKTVGDTGVIDEVVVDYGGLFFKDTGIIDSISILSAGTYYKALGDIESISILGGGEYYKEDPDGTPLVATVTVDLQQIAPSDGTGATFTVNVDDDPDSPTFGEIASVTVDDGGSGYEAVGIPNQFCMGEYMNGREVVLVRRKFVPDFQPGNPFPCQYIGFLCDPMAAGTTFGELNRGAYQLVAITFEFSATGATLSGPEALLTTGDALSDCSSFEVEFDNNIINPTIPAFANVTATVVSGGGTVENAIDPNLLEMAVDPFSTVGVCGSCCLNAAPTPVEVTVAIENLVEDPVTGSLADGDYVMIRDPFYEQSYPFFGNDNATIWRDPARGFFVVIEPCATLASTGPGILNTYVDAGCGDTCYKKCRLRIVFNEFGAVGAEYGVGCDGCVDGPMCAPPSGSYAMDGGFPATPYYTATIA